jgi:hypothetical protein
VHLSPAEYDHGQGVVDWHADQYQNTGIWYFALLLERIDETKFRRVGIAALSHRAYKAIQVEVQEFEIV